MIHCKDVRVEVVNEAAHLAAYVGQLLSSAKIYTLLSSHRPSHCIVTLHSLKGRSYWESVSEESLVTWT
jgi:hypothetical protein